MAGMKQVSGMALALALGAGPALAGDAHALDWLGGQWCSEEDGRRIDEAWLPEAGGSLLGMSRTVRDGKLESFEFMRIVVDGGTASFHVQPNGVPPTVFTAAARGDGWIRFENPDHDFPNQVEYRRSGDDGLSAWIAGPGPDGAELRIPFEYRRCAD